MIVDIEKALFRRFQTAYADFTKVVYPTQRVERNSKEHVVLSIACESSGKSINSSAGIWTEVMGQVYVLIVCDRGVEAASYARRQAIIAKLQETLPNYSTFTYNGLKIDLKASSVTPIFKDNEDYELDAFSVMFTAHKLQPLPAVIAIT